MISMDILLLYCIRKDKRVSMTEQEQITSNNKENDKKKKDEQDQIREEGNVSAVSKGKRIEIMTIIGEIEGHENLASSSKTTKYEHILPRLAEYEMDEQVKGVLFLLNTMGGDVEAGLAIAEMIASMSKPTVSLVLGGSHSIGVPIAVSTDYSMIVPTGTMVIHPVRLSGMVIGARQTYDYFKKIQERITQFVCGHCQVSKECFEMLMMETGMLTKDIGTILVGKEAVEHGIINKTGGLSSAINQLQSMI